VIEHEFYYKTDQRRGITNHNRMGKLRKLEPRHLWLSGF